MKNMSKKSLCGLFAVLFLSQAVEAEVVRKKFTNPSAYLVVEVLDDDLVHLEVSAIGSGPPVDAPLYTSPMVFKTDYSGPSFFSDNGNVIETGDIALSGPAKELRENDNVKKAYLGG